MKPSIFDRIRQAGQVLGGMIRLDEHVPIMGEFEITVYRADGSLERRRIRNQVTAAGLNRISNRAIMATGTTPFYIIGVGTVTAAASLDSTNFGEVANGRKTGVTNPNSSGLTATQSREWFSITATYGGFSDSLTGIVLDSAALLCHASSGQGAVMNIVNGMAVTLANSDILNVTGQVRVGSHNLAHSG
jgi:hypothetical protein